MSVIVIIVLTYKMPKTLIIVGLVVYSLQTFLVLLYHESGVDCISVSDWQKVIQVWRVMVLMYISAFIAYLSVIANIVFDVWG